LSWNYGLFFVIPIAIDIAISVPEFPNVLSLSKINLFIGVIPALYFVFSEKIRIFCIISSEN